MLDSEHSPQMNEKRNRRRWDALLLLMVGTIRAMEKLQLAPRGSRGRGGARRNARCDVVVNELRFLHEAVVAERIERGYRLAVVVAKRRSLEDGTIVGRRSARPVDFSK